MFEEQLLNALAFLQTRPIIAVIIGAIGLLLFYAKPQEMFKLLAFCLFLVVVFYCITLLAGTLSTGSEQKDQMIYKSKDVLGKCNGGAVDSSRLALIDTKSPPVWRGFCVLNGFA